jgi:hypothetical protein
VGITVNSVNDGPVNGVPLAQSVDEDTVLAIANLSINDLDNNLATTQLSVTNGKLNVNLSGGATINSGSNNSTTLTLSGTQTQINAALATLTYQGNLNFNGSDTLTVLSKDSDSASDSDAIAITINSIGDAPVNTVPGAQTVNEDTAIAISGLAVQDDDGNLATTRLTVVNGLLKVDLTGGATISAGANNAATLTLSGNATQINAALATLTYQGNANFNGADSLTILSTDSTGVPLTDTDSFNITVVSVTDIPVNTVPTAQTVDEDTVLTIAGLSINDLDNNLTSTQLSVTNGKLNVNLSGGATINSGSNNSTTLTLSGTQTQINSALATLTYQGNLNFNGSDTLTVLSKDSDGASDSDTIAITINAINEAPVNTVVAAQTVNEDTAIAISGISVNDVDGNLATAELSVAQGRIKVDLTGGATISSGSNDSATFTLSGNQTAINAALATITYQANTNFNGSDSLTILSKDNAGTPLSDSDAIAITVISIDDAPINTVPGTQTVTEDTATVISGLTVQDSDGNLATTRLTVANGLLKVDLTGGATISAGANNSATLTLSGSATQINAALATLTYQGNANFNGADSLTILSTDSTGVPLTDTDSFNITVVSVTDIPVNTVPTAQSVDEDTVLAIANLSINDLDNNLATTQLSVTNGKLNVNLSGGATINSGSNNSTTLTLSGTQTQINAALATLTYQGNLNFNGSDTLTVLSKDSDGASDSDTIAITVNAINEAPVNTVVGTQTVNEDTAIAISGISVNDVDGNLATAELSVAQGRIKVDLTGGATISSGSNDSATLTLSGNQTAINAALATITYQGNANFNGADSLTILSTDSTGVPLTDTDSFNITVVSVTDIPVNTVPNAQTVDEDTVLTIAGLSINDLDNNLTTTQLSVTNGKLNVNLSGGAVINSGSNNSTTLTLSGTQTQINAALATLTYQGNLNFNGSDTLTVLSKDGDNASDSDTIAITVNAINEAPVNTVVGTQTVNEDTAIAIPGISVNDVDGNLATAELSVAQGRIKVNLAGGATISSGSNDSATLTLSGNQTAINAALATITYQGNANFNGSDSLTILSKDNAGTPLSDSDAIAITVISVDDAPINTVPGAQTVNEDTAIAISGLTVQDGDGNLATTRLTVANGLLKVDLTGGATISAGANNAATLTLNGNATQINAALATLTYQGNANFNGADSLTILSTDSTGVPLTDTDSFNITVVPVTDIPVNTVPLAQTVDEDVVLAIANLSINDLDNNLTTTQLSVTNGKLNVNLSGATINSGSNNSSTFTLSGTQTQINAALATLTYQGNLNFNGSDTLTVVSTDGDNASDSDGIAITVNPINDLPVNTFPTGITVNEDQTIAIPNLSVTDLDNNLATTELTVTLGKLNVDLTGGATISAGANLSTTLTLSGTQTQINAALATVTYRGNDDYNGSDTLTVVSKDIAGSDTDTIAITINYIEDSPVNTVPGAQTLDEDGSLAIAGLQVKDVDGNLVSTQLTVTNGKLTVNTAGGGAATGNDSSSILLTGTQTQINAALATLSYTANPEFNGSDTLTMLSRDAIATSPVDTDTIAITVESVNDAPTNLTFNSTVTSLPENAVLVERLAVATFSLTDDNPELNEYRLEGTDRDLFVIDGTTVYLRADRLLDYETKPQLSVSLVVQDLTLTPNYRVVKPITIDITDIDETQKGFDIPANLTTTAGVAAQTLNNWATDLTQPGYPAGLNYVVTVDRPDLFEQLPTITPQGQLTYTPKAYVNLNADVILTVAVKQADGTIDPKLTKTTKIAFKYKPEALVRNSVSNELALLYIDRTTQLQQERKLTYGFGPQTGQAITLGKEWAIADTADFNRDGIADVLLHNQTGDEVMLMTMGAGAKVLGMQSLLGANGQILRSENPNWKVIGMADIDRDNILDITWHNAATDEIGFWFMNSDGKSVKSYDYLRDNSGNILKTQNPLWQMSDVADFDGDGDADLLFRLKELNQTAVIRLNGKNLVDSQYLAANADPTLEIRGIGDANNDRTTDIYWQNPTTQTIQIQTLNFQNNSWNSNFKSIAATAPLQGIGDLDLNNTADLLLQEPGANGLSIATVNGGAIAPTSNLQNGNTSFKFDSATWQIVEMDEFGEVIA